MTTSVEPDISRWRTLFCRVEDVVVALRGRMSWGAWMVSVLGLVTIVSRSPGLLYNGMFDRDESYLAVTGDVLRQGGTLYVDVIDRKPPIVPIMYSMIREWSVDMRTIRFVVALLIFLNGVVVAEIVRRLAGSRRAALFAGVLSIVGTALFLPADAQAANFELWGLLPASVAILCVVVARSTDRSPLLWFALAGVAVVFAANCKQPYIAVAIPVLIEALRRVDGKWRAVAAAAVGAAVGAIPLFVFFDGAKMIRWVWSDNGDYLNGGISTGRAAAIGVALTAVFVVLHLPLFYGLWAVIRRQVRADVTMLVWLGASLLVIPIGLRFFGHYFQQLVPPLAVLTGCALVSASRRVWQVLMSLTVALLAVMLTLAFVYRPDLTNYTDLGRYVQSTTTPDERILVWGALPDVYVASQRLPSGVFLHGGYLTGNWASRAHPLPESVIAAEPFRSRWDMFFEDVAEHPPAVVINAARPDTDWAMYGPESFPIGTWLERCYNIDRVVDGLAIWRRDVAACPM
ncbi:MAG: glycosyltransferase family 39 protein [Actinobacteria bacterium]|nr:glycosyltransferase family 39 protein [Actinomycetota bacterium]